MIVTFCRPGSTLASPFSASLAERSISVTLEQPGGKSALFAKLVTARGIDVLPNFAAADLAHRGKSEKRVYNS